MIRDAARPLFQPIFDSGLSLSPPRLPAGTEADGGPVTPGRLAGGAMRVGIALCLALAVTASASATDVDVMLRHGDDGSHYEGTGIGLRFGSWWSRDFGQWHTTLNPELEVNHFRYNGPASGPSNLNQAGAMGMFRLRHGDGSFRPFAEFGLGISLFSRDHLGGKNFSTPYQFSEHVGLGLEFAYWFAGWRFSHYSNAGIETPNDGIDLNQLVLGVSF